ncbi:MAG: Pr6Pr family membrane protein [Solirubrobacteraceae bacterium]
MSSQSEPLAIAGHPSKSRVGRVAAIRACRALAAIAVLVAISYQVTKGLEHHGFSATDYFSYFTELSNLFAAAMFLYGAVRPAGTRSRTVELLRGAAVVYMLTTGIVYAVLLSGQDVTYPWVNTIVHRMMPVAVALDWAIDPPRVRLRVRETILWLSFPLAYVAYTLARGAIVNWYPYFFVDPNRHGGYLLVAGDCAAITVGILALILATTWVGNRRSG